MESLDSSIPKYIAHRAANNTLSENSLESMKKIHSMGALSFEIDCHLMKDGSIAVIHDEKIDRVTTGKGKITKMNWGDLSKITLIKGGKIPKLEDVMEYAYLHNLYLMIEVKGKNLAIVDLIDRLINSYGGDLFTIYSFERKIIEAFVKKNPNYKIRWNMDKLSEAKFKLAKQLGVAINLNVRYVKESDIEKLKTLDREIHIYTVNDQNRANELFKMGVTSIITDTLIEKRAKNGKS
jgi:glycerophosphoryl diester phosphodiesterase